jgi:hypothetical protein
MVNRLPSLFYGVMAAWLMASALLEAGVGIVDITLPIPFRMAGYFKQRICTEIS